MLFSTGNRYLTALLVVLALIDVGLQSPTTTPDPSTAAPIQPTESTTPSSSSSSSSSNQVASSSSLSDDSSSDADSSLKTTEEELPPTAQPPLPQTSQTTLPDPHSRSPTDEDSSVDPVPPTSESSPETTLPVPTSERSTVQHSSQQDEEDSDTHQPNFSTENPPTISPSDEQFNSLAEEFFQWKLQILPEFATSIGVNDETAGHLSNLSIEEFEKRKLKVANFLERAEVIDQGGLSENVSLFYKIFVQELIFYLENYEYVKFYVPFNQLLGPHSYLAFITSVAVLETHNDYLKLISRYNEFPRQINESITLMQNGINEGITLSNWSVGSVPDQLDGFLLPVNESHLYEPFVNITINITAEEEESLQKQALVAVSNVLTAIREFKDFIETEYLPETRPNAGVSSLPNGLSFYQACLKFHTTTDMTPQEIHDLGLSEVARIREAVQEVGAALGLPNKTLSEISEIVKNDPKQKFKSKEDLLDTYRYLVYNNLYPLMDRVVDEISSINVTVKGTSGGYVSYKDPPVDGSGPGTFYVNTNLYDSHLRNEITAWALHETVPGHHLHATTLMAKKDLPKFLKNIGPYDMRDVPAKFPLYTAFVEGWGLYAEFLGEELDLYEDPYQRFGRYSIESLRACRLVVDTGIHAFNWTRQEAVDYLLENTAMTKKAVEGQIDRYISWPGQATAYKIGELKIRELREKAERTLGSQFRLQEFHKVIMECTAPLNILEECVDSYVNKTLLNNQQKNYSCS